jgi:hypothetical protein
MSVAAAESREGSAHGVATPALDWLVETLWGMPSGVEVSPGRRRRRSRAGDTFAVLPSAAHPRLLVPLGSRKAASNAVREYTTGKKGIRFAKPLLTIGIRSGLVLPLLRDRVHISVAGDVPPAELRQLLLQEHLQEIFGRRDLEIAVKFDAPRPQRKPILHILGKDGAALGFAKVGWNDLTRPLIRNEARTLERLRPLRGRLREFDVPELIHAGRWRDLEIVIVAPVSFGARRRFLSRLPLAATDEVAELSGTRRSALGLSPFWLHTRERIRATATAEAGPVARLEDVAEEIERRYGDARLEFGSWHGDWVPWNMGHRDGRLYVWDWERSGELAPRGLDGVSFDYQAELGLRRTAPVPALDATLHRSARALPELNRAATDARLLLSLHLLEMALRFDEARTAGVDTADRKYLGALKVLLSSTDGATA